MRRVEQLSDDVVLHLGDCREILPTLRDVDLILTDPPYPKEFQPLFGQMACAAKGSLVTGGSLVTLCGHFQVPDVLNDMGEHLRYWWIGGMSHTSKQRLPGKWVAIGWKPALWFVKERRKPGDTECPVDLLEGGGKDKDHHEWGQPVHWFSHWIERLTGPGGIVVDPFMGAGTTGVAAVKLGRRFAGIELNPEHFDTSCRRIEAALRQPDMFIPKAPPPKQEAMF